MPDQDFEQDLALVLAGKKSVAELLGLERDHVSILGELAYLYYGEGRYDEARTLFEGLLSLEPANAYFCRALGAVYQRLGTHDLALRYYQRSVKLNEQEAETWANMGEVLLLEGQTDRGVTCLEKADQLYRARQGAAPQHRRVQAILRKLRKG